MVNNFGEVPSPYFTPIFDKNSNNSPVYGSTTMPFDYMYIFLIILISPIGMSKS
jgi:hypothetical protein